jgi:hypothetical protein
MIKKTLYKINKFFEIHIGWMFINGYKQKKYYKYLKNKYGK